MSNSRLICASLLFVTSAMVGCGSKPQSQPQPSPYARSGGMPARVAPSPATQPAQSPIVQSQPMPGTAQALAERAQSYAHSVGPIIVKRQPRPNAPDAAAQPAQAVETRAPATQETVPVANVGISAAPSDRNEKPATDSAQASIDDKVASAPASTAAADALARKLAQRAKDFPQDLSAQLDDELFKLIQDGPVPELQALAGLSAEDRELLTALLDAMTNFRNQLRADNNMLLSRKIRPLVELADRVRGQAELSVPTCVLCTRVQAFGSYDPMDPPRFMAGKDNKAVVYCEVENFLSQLNDQKRYETRLAEDIVLYTEASGLEVWHDRKSTCVDLSRNRRHDFFLVKKITLPSNLTIGRYLLKVTVEDEQARHIAENTVPVEIVAQ